MALIRKSVNCAGLTWRLIKMSKQIKVSTAVPRQGAYAKGEKEVMRKKRENKKKFVCAFKAKRVQCC